MGSYLYKAINGNSKLPLYSFVFFLALLLQHYNALAENAPNNELISNTHKQVSLYIDKDGVHSIKSISADDIKWEKLSDSYLSFGFSQHIYWIKIKLENHTFTRANYFIELDSPLLDQVDFYLLKDSKTLKTFKTGDLFDIETRPLEHRSFVFPVEAEPKTEYEVYLSVKSTSSIYLPIKILKQGDWHKSLSSESLLLGAFYGIIAVMLLYNLCYSIVIKDQSSLYYVLYMGTLAAGTASMSGLTSLYFWPYWPQWANTCIPFLMCFGTMWAIVFSRSFLDTSRSNVLIDYYLKVLLLITFGSSFFSLFVRYSVAIHFSAALSVFSLLSLLLVGSICFLRGFKPARFYIFANGFSLLGIFIRVMLAYGVLPPVFLTIWSVEIGAAIEVILLSYALADRFYNLRTQREAANLYAYVSQLKIEKVLNENKELTNTIETTLDNQKELQISRDRLSHLLNMDQEAILVFEECKVVYANQKAASILNYSESDLLQLSIADIFTENTTKNIVSDAAINSKFLNNWIDMEYLTSDKRIGMISAIFSQKYIGNRKSLILVMKTDLYTDRTDGDNAAILSNNNSISSQEVISFLRQILTKSIDAEETSVSTGIDNASDKHNSSNTDLMFRESLVRVMQLSLDLWAKQMNKDKISLAEESGLWRVYVDRSTVVTRTLDRYLRVETLPKRPRWNYVISTADYVLEKCQDGTEDRVSLENELQALKKNILY